MTRTLNEEHREGLRAWSTRNGRVLRLMGGAGVHRSTVDEVIREMMLQPMPRRAAKGLLGIAIPCRGGRIETH